MALSPEFLDTVACELTGLALDPADARIVAAMLAAQRDGLRRLDDLALGLVEPAVGIHADEEPCR